MKFYTDLQINIIFTPGTVRYLRLATLTLLEHSPYRFRLISNALPLKELQLLKEFCNKNSRLELLCLPGNRLLPHGIAVSLALSKTNSEFFCIADSDVFASGPFYGELEANLPNYDIFSVCDYSWSNRKQEAPTPRAHGSKAIFDNWLPTTFFCVYRTEVLQRILNETGLFYERYKSRELLPDNVLLILNELKIMKNQFDTGKLVSLCAFYEGYRIKHNPINDLIHIGGMSNSITSKVVGNSNSTIYNFLSQLKLLNGRRIKNTSKRTILSDYVSEHLKYIFNERDCPVFPTEEEASKEVVMKACGSIKEIYDKHRGLLMG